MIRLNKYLSEAGVCSRREADRLIESGIVTVDGKTAAPGMKVEDGQKVRVGKKVVKSKTEKTVLAVYKPAGIVCTEDKREKKNIIRFLNYPVRITYAGRLDKDSEGLLIMTNDGDLINGMMRARYAHEKEYKVRVNKEVTPEFIEKMSRKESGCGDQTLYRKKDREIYIFHYSDTGIEQTDTAHVRSTRI